MIYVVASEFYIVNCIKCKEEVLGIVSKLEGEWYHVTVQSQATFIMNKLIPISIYIMSFTKYILVDIILGTDKLSVEGEEGQIICRYHYCWTAKGK